MNRRQFLGLSSSLIGIPWYALLSDTSRTDAFMHTTKTSAIDLTAYRGALETIWDMNHLDTAVSAVPIVRARIAALYEALSGAHSRQAKEVHELLCRYHILLASIVEDQQDYETAMLHENRAVQLAREDGDEELIAVTLYRRASTRFVKGEDEAAYRDYAASDALHTRLNTPIRWATRLKLGVAGAKLAQSAKAKDDIVRLIDEVGNAIQRGDVAGVEDIHAFRLTEERFHLDKAAALIELQRSDAALNELTMLSINEDKQGLRRCAYRDLLLARAYAQRKDYPQAVHFAQKSLEAAQAVQSHINIHRIAQLYEDLTMTDYGMNSEATQPGHMLRGL